MSQDLNQLKFLASKGHFGHDAALDPDTFAAKAAPELGPLVAQNNVNEFGIADSAVLGSSREAAPASNFRYQGSPEQDAKINQGLNDRLLKKYSQQEIDAYMNGGELPEK